MKLVASLDPETCSKLAVLLKDQQVASEVRTTTDQNGLEQSELLVDDASFDKACDLIERWQEEQQKEAAERNKQWCPKCHSIRLQAVEDEHYEKFGLTVLKCLDCGELIPR